MKRKDLILFVSIFCVLCMIAGGTYAYWAWESDTNKTVVFNTSKGIKDYFIYDSGDSHFVGNFQTSDDYCEGRSNTISFSKTEEVSSEVLTATIKMDVNKLGSNTRSSEYVKWAITPGDADDCNNNALNTGKFKNVADGSVITLKTDIEINTFIISGESYTKSDADEFLNPKGSDYFTNLDSFRNMTKANGNMFTIWVWIDENCTDCNNGNVKLGDLSGETIDVNIWTQVDMTSED